MNNETLLIDLSAPIASITFNKPDKANYIHNEWIAPMKEFFDEVAKNKEIRCVVIKGNGRHFMAGGDLNYHDYLMALKPQERLTPLVELIDEWNTMMKAMLNVPQPIIARIQGGVVGASVGLVAACDLVIASENAFFVVAHALHGGAIDGLITYFLPRQIGYKKAMHLSLLGERVDAMEAERLGLVGKVVPNDEFEKEAEKLIDHIANGPTLAYQMIKQQIMSSLDHSIDEQALLENINTSKSAMTKDWEEGSVAVFKKRKANFIGA
jgi:2-(1,2-epoxy-1,2-dihydrophenyl)acetyl-CoA isomerase